MYRCRVLDMMGQCAHDECQPVDRDLYDAKVRLIRELERENELLLYVEKQARDIVASLSKLSVALDTYRASGRR